MHMGIDSCNENTIRHENYLRSHGPGRRPRKQTSSQGDVNGKETSSQGDVLDSHKRSQAELESRIPLPFHADTPSILKAKSVVSLPIIATKTTRAAKEI